MEKKSLKYFMRNTEPEIVTALMTLYQKFSL